MLRTLRALTLGTSVLLVGCLPQVVATERPRGLGAQVMSHKVGEETFIYLTVPRVGPEPGWGATFLGDTPPGLTTEETSDATILRWRVNMESLRRRHSQDYRLTLRREASAYEVTVTAIRPSQHEPSGLLLLDIIAHIIPRR